MQIMLSFLAIRRELVARRLDFNGKAGPNNQIVNFALADYEYKKLFLKINGQPAVEDEYDEAWRQYYLRVKYKRSSSVNQMEGNTKSRAKAPATGVKSYNYKRSQGQVDLIAKEELDALADDIANML